MMHEPSRELLRDDPNTVILSPLRHSCGIECTGPSRLLDRAGVTVRQWQHRERRYLFPIREMPAVIAQAERDRRTVVIDDQRAVRASA